MKLSGFISVKKIFIFNIFFLFTALTSNSQEKSIHLDLLLQNRAQSIQFQKNLKDWMEGYPQMDDILIVGVRV